MNRLITPLVQQLGYRSLVRQPEVETREGLEDGGWLYTARSACLRAWSVTDGVSLNAPPRLARAYRFSPMRSAHRVLLAAKERLGLLTDGAELRLLLSDPARPESHIAVPVAGSTG